MTNEETKQSETEAVEEVQVEAVDTEQAESIGELQAKLEEMQQQVDAFKDQGVRAQAEVQNVRRRAEQDVEKAHKFALEKFVNGLLPVVDSLERALGAIAADDEQTKTMREGVEMTLNMFVETLKKEQIEQLRPEGEPFDPQLHQAMSMLENADVEPGTVLNVLQPGYTLNGRLVRAAMVIVSKAAASQIDEQA